MTPQAWQRAIEAEAMAATEAEWRVRRAVAYVHASGAADVRPYLEWAERCRERRAEARPAPLEDRWRELVERAKDWEDLLAAVEEKLAQADYRRLTTGRRP